MIIAELGIPLLHLNCRETYSIPDFDTTAASLFPLSVVCNRCPRNVDKSCFGFRPPKVFFAIERGSSF
jgi:hypothetical protein